MKVVIIGGGSAYTPDIIAGLLKHPQVFAGWELALHDVDEKNLQVVARLARGMVRAVGIDLTVSATTDRASAVTGASFILTQPRVGGLQARARDERIPLKHGIIGQETLGPGGLSFAWRTIPLLLQIVAEARQLAPKAWIINYANPAGMVTEAVIQRFRDARFIGLCDMPTGLEWALGKLLRVDFHRVDLDYAGINHGGWCHRVLVDGKDQTDRLRRLLWLLGPAAKLLPISEATGTLRLFQAFGLVPDPYLRYYYFKAAILAKLQRQARTRAEALMERLPLLYKHYERASAARQPMLTMHRGHQSHGDLASQVIAAMAAGRRTRFVIQQRNGGAVPNLPCDAAAQFPAWVGPDGWEPIPMPPLPEAAAALIRRVQQSESLNVRAALTGDLNLAAAAAAENPLVPGRAVARRVVEELVRAHRPYLPQFR